MISFVFFSNNTVRDQLSYGNDNHIQKTVNPFNMLSTKHVVL